MQEFVGTVVGIVGLLAIGWNVLLRLALRPAWRHYFPERRRIKLMEPLDPPNQMGKNATGDGPEWLLVQLWFRSDEEVLAARGVWVAVTVMDRSGKVVAHETCPWAVGTHPTESGSWQSLERQVDIQPDRLPAKLNLAGNRLDGDGWYLFSAAKHKEHVPASAWRVRVQLFGVQTASTFDFSLDDYREFRLEPLTGLRRIKDNIGR